MNIIPILCMACGRRSERPIGQVTASLRCPCGSTELDIDDPIAISASASLVRTAIDYDTLLDDDPVPCPNAWCGTVLTNHELASRDGICPNCHHQFERLTQKPGQVQTWAPGAPDQNRPGSGYPNIWPDFAGPTAWLPGSEEGRRLSVRRTAEAIDTSSSAYSESWSGQHWSIIQEQREGMCLWTVQTGGRPKTGGNYDVGLREAVRQVRAELDARGLPGEPEQILPPDREGSWITSSKVAISRQWTQDPVYGFNYIYLPDDNCTGRVDPIGNGRWKWIIESYGRYGFAGRVQSEGEADSFRGAQMAVESWAIENSIDIAASRRTAAPSANEGLGQPVTGDCPRCGSGTYRGDLGYCPQCQFGGPGDPSATKDSFASKVASVPASPIDGNRMLPIVRWETPDGTEYVDIYNNAGHGDYVWQAGWTKDNYDRYAETQSGSYPHHIVSFPEFLQTMARRVKFNKLVLKFNRTGYDVEGIINGPLLPRLVSARIANWDPAQADDPHNPYASIQAFTFTGPIETNPVSGDATGIRCTAPGCSWSTTATEAIENPRRRGGNEMVNAWQRHAIEKMDETYGGNVAASRRHSSDDGYQGFVTQHRDSVVTREQHDALEHAAWKNRNQGHASHYLMPDGSWQIVLSQDEEAFRAANPGAEFGSSSHVPSDYPKTGTKTAGGTMVADINLGDGFYGLIKTPELVLPGEQPFIWKLWGSNGNMGGVDLDAGRADTAEAAEAALRAARKGYGKDATPGSAQQDFWKRHDSSKKTAKIEEIAMGILSTNPSMPRTRAIAVARRTVERFPGVAQ